MPISNRSYAAAHFALELDVGPVGLFRSIHGGAMRADVLSYQAGGMYDRWKQLGKPKFEDIRLEVGMAMSAPFYMWISDFFKGIPVRHTGSIIAADFYYQERARRTFAGAMISEITFPRLDAADKNAAYMGVGIAVEDLVFTVGSGAPIAQLSGMESQKLWTSCNFRFTLDGLDFACRRVSKVESFTVKQRIIDHHVGGYRGPFKLPSQIEFPHLVFYVPEADAAAFYAKATLGIQAGVTARMTGSLEVFDNSGSPLFVLVFMNADIFSVTPDKSDAHTEEIKQVRVELYTEHMIFQYLGSTVGAVLSALL